MLLHDEPTALFGAEIERAHGSGFGRFSVRGFHVVRHLPLRISDARQERDARARGFALDGLRGRVDMHGS